MRPTRFSSEEFELRFVLVCGRPERRLPALLVDTKRLQRLGAAEGQPLLIIEAMKVMNQIRAHRPGRVAQILIADAQPVEYGAILMLIE